MNFLTTRTAIVLMAASTFVAAQNYRISTIAGGTPPPSTGAALNAALGQPTAVAADAAGNVYFTTSLNALFKMDSKGVFTRIAGTGRADFSGDGGPAVNAALNQPNGLAIDSKGDIFISDFGNQRIREITPNGTIKTYAGNGNSGSGGDGGPATSATFIQVHGIALDSSGNLFVADFGAQVVRKITTDGNIATIAGVAGTAAYAGDGAAATLANLNSPSGVAVDASGNVYIADSANNVVRKVTTDGNIATFAGNNTAGAGFAGDTGPAASAQLHLPESLVIDKAGSLYIADYANAVIRIVVAAGTIGTYAGTASTSGFAGDGGQAASAQLNGVVGMALDASGNFYIADFNNYRVRKINPSNVISSIAGGSVVTFSGDGGPATQAALGTPYGVAVDGSGNVYFSDYENFRVRKIASNGTITTFAGNGTPGYSGDNGPAIQAQLYPRGLAFDASGNLYIADYLNNVVRKVSANGTITTYAGNRGLGGGYSGDGGKATAAQLNMPAALAFDPSGNLFIADWSNFVIRRVTSFGLISTVAGNNVRGYSGDGGAGTSAMLDYVNGLATDVSGNLYISDWANFRIRKLTTGGIIFSVAGNGDEGYSGDNVAALNSSLGYANGIVVDALGNIYFSDSLSSRIRKIDGGGTITTIAGEGDNGYTGDGGPATLAELFYPLGLARDSKGNFYFADSENKAIRTLQLPVSGSGIDVTNAASNQITALVPGEIVTLYGNGMGPEALVQAVPAGGAFPQKLAGTEVFINGVAAPLIYSSSKQTAAVVPFDVAGTNQATVEVRYNGQSLAPFNLPVKPSAPAIFSTDASGAGQAAALNQDTSPNGAGNPAHRGGVLVLYATGGGQTNPGGVNGRQVQLVSGTGTYPRPVLPVSVTIGGLPATVQYVGAAPGEIAGLMQINLLIPSGVTPGNAVPVVLTVGGKRSQGGMTIAISF